MTKNQIDYANYRESQRTHLANEELGRINAAIAQQEANTRAAAAAETARANRANEEIARNRLASEYEVNMTNAQTRQAELAESSRHSQATESVQSYTAGVDASLGAERLENERRGQNMSAGTNLVSTGLNLLGTVARIAGIGA